MYYISTLKKHYLDNHIMPHQSPIQQEWTCGNVDVNKKTRFHRKSNRWHGRASWSEGDGWRENSGESSRARSRTNRTGKNDRDAGPTHSTQREHRADIVSTRDGRRRGRAMQLPSQGHRLNYTGKNQL